MKEWIEKAQRERAIVDDTLKYWREVLKDDNGVHDEEKIIFVAMHVIDKCNLQRKSQPGGSDE